MSIRQYHPHIILKMRELWGKPEQFEAYIESLLVMDRENRQGFSFNIMQEIALVQDAHRILYGVPPRAYQHPEL